MAEICRAASAGDKNAKPRVENMPLEFLGKILFPRQPDWQRNKQLKTIFVAAIVAVFFASLVAGLMLYAAYKR